MDKRTIDCCRRYYQLPDDVTDEQVAKECEGNLGHQRCNLALAVQDIKAAIYDSLPNWLRSWIKGRV